METLEDIIKEVKKWHKEQEEMLVLMIENAYKTGQLLEVEKQLTQMKDERNN